MTCTGQPVSWLALERYALGELAGAEADAVAAHVGACPACRAALARIEGDAVALPPLAPAAARPRRAAWPRLAWAAGALAAAAAVAVIAVGRGGHAPAPAERRVRVKGGELVVSVVRERGGRVALDASTFAVGDRLAVRLTCTPPALGVPLAADVVVFQGGEASFPAPVAQLACGNDVTLPGAFRITDAAPATVCLAIGDRAPDRRAIARRGPRGPGLACVRLAPE